ncbi:MAG: hypothetical protein HOJ88_07190 [Proteobacteria bacterium]|nr:hypothetical protein [Pseudomonadota bacterium]
MKDYGPISLKLHATGDLFALTFLLVSPWLLGFSQYSIATQYTVALFVIGMGLNFITDYPLGLFKIVSFKWHRIVELTSPLIFIVVPWYFFSDAGLMPWVATVVGVGAVINSFLTKPLEL